MIIINMIIHYNVVHLKGFSLITVVVVALARAVSYIPKGYLAMARTPIFQIVCRFRGKIDFLLFSHMFRGPDGRLGETSTYIQLFVFSRKS